MRAKLILAMVFAALGIGLLLWSSKQSGSDQQSPTPPNTAKNFEPAARRMGHVLIVAGLVFAVLAIYPNFRKPRSPTKPPPSDGDDSRPFGR